MFKRNEGILDRIVRVTLGMVLVPAGLFWLGGWQGSVLGLLIAGIGVLGLITGLTGICILYIPFGISTLEKEKELITKCAFMAAGCRTSGDPSTGQRCGSCSPVDRENL
jgi:Inner membrane protein YgaP-like, transmembrane domain